MPDCSPALSATAGVSHVRAGPMRLTCWLLGREILALDLSRGEPETEGVNLDGGTTSAMPVGFVAAMEVPAEVPWTERDNGWGDEE